MTPARRCPRAISRGSVAPRRHPDRTQPDYAVLRVLARELQVLDGIETPVSDVLDLFAATQPYRDLLPPHETYVSMDIDEHYPQDVVSDQFLPFADEAFDLILFTEGFHYDRPGTGRVSCAGCCARAAPWC